MRHRRRRALPKIAQIGSGAMSPGSLGNSQKDEPGSTAIPLRLKKLMRHAAFRKCAPIARRRSA
jgi:hypothetical protein